MTMTCDHDPDYCDEIINISITSDNPQDKIAT